MSLKLLKRDKWGVNQLPSARIYVVNQLKFSKNKQGFTLEQVFLLCDHKKKKMNVLQKDLFFFFFLKNGLLCTREAALLPHWGATWLPFWEQKSIFRKQRDPFFFFLVLSSSSLGAFCSREEGPLNGPSSSERLCCPPFLPLAFSPVVFAGRIGDEEEDSNRNKQSGGAKRCGGGG